MTDCQIAVLRGDNSDIILKKNNSYKPSSFSTANLINYFLHIHVFLNIIFVFLCHSSHLHALNLVSDVEHEVVVAHHLYVVEQAHDETADAEVACHVGGEKPVARVVVDWRDAGRRGGICYPKISFNSLLLNLPIQFSPLDTVISASARLLLIMSLMRSSKVFLVIKRCTITFFFCPIR